MEDDFGYAGGSESFEYGSGDVQDLHNDGDDDFDPQGTYNAKCAPGRHVFVVDKAKVTLSRAGNKMIEVVFKVADKSDQSYLCEVKDCFPLKRNAFWKLQQLCLAIDPNMRRAGPENPNGFNPRLQSSVADHLLGNCLAAEADHEESTFVGDDGRERKGINVRLRDYEPLARGDEHLLENQGGYQDEEIPF